MPSLARGLRVARDRNLTIRGSTLASMILHIHPHHSLSKFIHIFSAGWITELDYTVAFECVRPTTCRRVEPDPATCMRAQPTTVLPRTYSTYLVAYTPRYKSFQAVLLGRQVHVKHRTPTDANSGGKLLPSISCTIVLGNAIYPDRSCSVLYEPSLDVCAVHVASYGSGPSQWKAVPPKTDPGDT